MRRKYSTDILGQKAFTAQLPEALSKDKDSQDQVRRFIQSAATKRDLKKLANDVTTDIGTAVSTVTTQLSTKAIVVGTSGATSIAHNTSGTFSLADVEYDPETWWEEDDVEVIRIKEDGVYLLQAEFYFYLEIGNYSEAWECSITSTLYDAAAGSQDAETRAYKATADGTIIGSTTDIADVISFNYVLPRSCLVGDYLKFTYDYVTYSGNDPGCSVDVRVTLAKVG